MIKELMHDPIFLAAKSSPADENDLQTAEDLLDTLISHREDCVGMAANMIGEKKRIIAFLDERPEGFAGLEFSISEPQARQEPFKI